jgi:hypothetical protein
MITFGARGVESGGSAAAEPPTDELWRTSLDVPVYVPAVSDDTFG